MTSLDADLILDLSWTPFVYAKDGSHMTTSGCPNLCKGDILRGSSHSMMATV